VPFAAVLRAALRSASETPECWEIAANDTWNSFHTSLRTRSLSRDENRPPRRVGDRMEDVILLQRAHGYLVNGGY
jgi:hypothetical protein